jgi:hypothetical protein
VSDEVLYPLEFGFGIRMLYNHAGTPWRTRQSKMNESIVYRLRKRAEIRRQISTRKSVQEGKPDRIADLLDEAANEIVAKRDNIRHYCISALIVGTVFVGLPIGIILEAWLLRTYPK